jgi:branched-chain amino acid transport system ATP-binding protein
MMALLEVKGVSKHYGGVAAVSDVDMVVDDGEIIGLIGPNGAGKTTLFNCISGVDDATSGRVLLGGRDITGLAPHRRSRLGMARTFQNMQLFSRMSVLDNLRTAVDTRTPRGLLADALRLPRSRFEERRSEVLARSVLHLLDLDDVVDEVAADLPIGTQRRVELARALCLQPRILLLDEPAAGLDAAETAGLCTTLEAIVERFGTALLLIDHDMALVMRTCDHVYVLDRGQLIAEGPPSLIRENPTVVRAYLGEAA